MSNHVRSWHRRAVSHELTTLPSASNSTIGGAALPGLLLGCGFSPGHDEHMIARIDANAATDPSTHPSGNAWAKTDHI